MKQFQIAPNLWMLSVSDPAFRGFRRAAYTDSGVMYNAYLLDTGDGWAAIGTVPVPYQAAWTKAVLERAGGNLCWLILMGTDDDASAAALLSQMTASLQIFCGVADRIRLEAAGVNSPVIEILGTRSLSLGRYCFRFETEKERFEIPGLIILDETGHRLFTADLFGSVCATEVSRVSELPEPAAYVTGIAKYLADQGLPESRERLRAMLSRVEEAQIQEICPAMGPIADAGLDVFKNLCSPSVEEHGASARVIAVVFAPGSYVREIAARIEAGIREKEGVDVCVVDLAVVPREEALERLRHADMMILGTPDIRGDAAKAVWDLATSLDPSSVEGKTVSLFCSGNLTEQAAESLRARLRQIGCDSSMSDLIVTGIPDERVLENAFEYGYDAACRLLQVPNGRRPSLVLCLVCGEIFDASLGTCPVCGVGLDQCVPVDADAPLFHQDSDRDYVIVGGGIAGVSAAEAIRLRDRTGRITILSSEPHLPINRPRLSKDLIEAVQPGNILIHPPEWYEERGIHFLTGTAVTRVDMKTQTVQTLDGKSFHWDRLIWAAGAECFAPPFPGRELDGVLTIRHTGDLTALLQRVKPGGNAVIIGGGVIGLEMSNELLRMGMHATVLEATPQIMGRQIDSESARILRGLMERLGAVCYEDVVIERITGDGRAEAVNLSDGRSFPADLVLVSCGVRPNAKALQDAGVKIGRSIEVNSRMETSLPSVYACGDCAEFEKVNVQLWQEASLQGRTAGANATGDTSVTYQNQLYPLHMDAFGTSLHAIGDAGKNGLDYRTVVIRDEVAERHENYFFFGGRLEGAVLIGAPDKVQEISRAVILKSRHEELF